VVHFEMIKLSLIKDGNTIIKQIIDMLLNQEESSVNYVRELI